MIVVRPSHSEDPHDLAPMLRLADVEELAACDMTPLEGLLNGYDVSEYCFTAEIDDEVVAMFGVAADDETSQAIGMLYGNIWYLGSPKSVTNAKLFMRECRSWLRALEGRYDVLGNIVDVRNTKHVRWIKAMGFKFIGTETVHGEEEDFEFLRFYKTCEGPACVPPH